MVKNPVEANRIRPTIIDHILNQTYYSKTEPLPCTLSDMAMQILEKKYLKGETPEEMFKRVVNAVAKPLEDKISFDDYTAIKFVFYNLMASKDFLPNSPTLMNAGRPLNQLAACFVVPVGDSMEDIFRHAIADMAMIQRTGGGTGFDFSELRPRGSVVTSTQGESSGPISFMRAFNACTDTIKQGGARRGANMGIMRVDHPDIMEFIDVKSDPTEMTNFNLSVAITDKFMAAVEADTNYELVHKGKVYGKLKAREVWDHIAQHAWQTGEPGIVFIDTVNKDNHLPGLGNMAATNPCGEQPLLPYEACNLGSINLMCGFVPERAYDYAKLEVVTEIATLFLDCVIDAGTYPLPEIDTMVKGNRKIGLGVMGFADLCYAQEKGYDTPEAKQLANVLMRTIQDSSHVASFQLADAFGPFPNIDKSIFANAPLKPRNATTTTIAPTGTISIIAGVSYGIEPFFALSYTKYLTEGGTLEFVNEALLAYMQHYNFSEDLKQAILAHIKQYGTLQNFSCDFPEPSFKAPALADMKGIFVTAQDIVPSDHIGVQACFQRHTDNAVSKTINFSNNVSVEDIQHAFAQAYKMKCKGVTVYRDGCLASQPMKVDSTPVPVVSEIESQQVMSALKRPKQLPGITRQIDTGCGMMLVTANMDENNNVFEVLMRAGATGGCSAYTDAVARLLSIALRWGVPIDVLIDQLRSVKCDNFRFQAGRNPELKGKSCPDVVGKFLQDIVDEQKDKSNSVASLTPEQLMGIVQQAAEHTGLDLGKITIDGKEVPRYATGGIMMIDAPKKGDPLYLCPECHAKLQHSEGCLVCASCGFSKC